MTRKGVWARKMGSGDCGTKGGSRKRIQKLMVAKGPKGRENSSALMVCKNIS